MSFSVPSKWSEFISLMSLKGFFHCISNCDAKVCLQKMCSLVFDRSRCLCLFLDSNHTCMVMIMLLNCITFIIQNAHWMRATSISLEYKSLLISKWTWIEEKAERQKRRQKGNLSYSVLMHFEFFPLIFGESNRLNSSFICWCCSSLFIPIICEKKTF